MAVKAGDIEQGLIESLGQSVSERLAGEPVAAYQEFVRQYYHWVPAKDLADRDQADLCGSVVAHWRTARTRARGEAKVHVYNPDRKRDGWQSPYTVLEVVSDDMPFIVDSVTMELGRQGYPIELIIHPVMRVVRDPDGELTEVLAPGAGRGRLPHRIGDPRRGRPRVRSGAARGPAGGRRTGARGGAGHGGGLGTDARPDDGAGHRASPPGAPGGSPPAGRGGGVPGLAGR